MSPAEGASLASDALVAGLKALASPEIAPGGRALPIGGDVLRGVEERGGPGVVAFALEAVTGDKGGETGIGPVA